MWSLLRTLLPAQQSCQSLFLENVVMEKVQELPIGKLVASQNALRLAIKEEGLDDLASSIRRIGIVVPLLVVAEGDAFRVVAGHRRLLAAQRCSMEMVPVIVRGDSDAETKEIALASNLFREDLSPVETACAIDDLIKSGDFEVGDIARMMHRSENWISRQLALLSWPADVLGAVHDGAISVSAASNLALVTDDVYRNFLLQNAVDSGATARTTSAWLQAWRAQLPPAEAIVSEPAAGPSPNGPPLPQAPCIACGEVHRHDAMSMVMICSSCINAIRGAVR